MDFKEFVTHGETAGPKPWKAKRADVISFWSKLRPNLPIQPQMVPKHHSGTKFHYDGFRVTGSPQFINSVLSRLKDLLEYERQPNSKLEVEYRQIETKSGDLQEKPVFAFYFHVLEDHDTPNIAKPYV